MSYQISYINMRPPISDKIFESVVEWNKHPALLPSFYKSLDLKIINIKKVN